MGSKFLLALLTFSAIFFTFHTVADGSPANPDLPPSLTSRALLHNLEPKTTMADPPSAERETEAEAEAPAEWESRKIGKHHSSDKSEAGGGVIIGGLVTAIFAAVYCYIRVTRRKHTDNLT